MKRPKQQSSIRFSESEKRSLQALANKYTCGNLSLWIIFSGTYFRPTTPQIKALKAS